MSTSVTVTVDLADVIPACTGLLIFTSVLLAGTTPTNPQFDRNRTLSWSLGALSQGMLVGFGMLTGTYTFGSHAFVAVAFLSNIYRGHPRRRRSRHVTP